MNESIANMTLLISPAMIKSLGPLDSNLNEDTIKAVIKYSQDTKIQQLLGTPLYVKLLHLIEDKEVCDAGNECFKELLDGYVKWILAWKVKGELVLDFSAKLRNAGVKYVVDANLQTPTTSDLWAIQQKWFDRADSYIVKLQNYMRCKNECFAEYQTYDCGWCCSDENAPDHTNGTHNPFFFPKNHCWL